MLNPGRQGNKDRVGMHHNSAPDGRAAIVLKNTCLGDPDPEPHLRADPQPTCLRALQKRRIDIEHSVHKAFAHEICAPLILPEMRQLK